MTRRIRPLVVALVVLLATLVPSHMLAQDTASTAGTGSIDLRMIECPSGSDPAACLSNGLAGVDVILDGPVRLTGATSDTGTLRWDALPPGNYTIAEAVMRGDDAGYAVTCTDGDIDLPVETRGNGRAAVLLTLPAGADITCTWANIPAGSAPVALPATGSGAATPGRAPAAPLLGIIALGAAIAGLAVRDRGRQAG